MFRKYLPIAALALVIVAIAGYQFRVELLDALCGTTPPAPQAQIEEALENNAMILDVRMYVETRKEGANLIPEAKNIPLLRLWWNLDGLPRDRTIITYCESGKRAGKVADMLNARGFKAISGGGILNLQEIINKQESNWSKTQ
jgi:rhodanese-related sulfurtransferase